MKGFKKLKLSEYYKLMSAAYDRGFVLLNKIKSGTITMYYKVDCPGIKEDTVAIINAVRSDQIAIGQAVLKVEEIELSRTAKKKVLVNVDECKIAMVAVQALKSKNAWALPPKPKIIESKLPLWKALNQSKK